MHLVGIFLQHRLQHALDLDLESEESCCILWTVSTYVVEMAPGQRPGNDAFRRPSRVPARCVRDNPRFFEQQSGL